MRAKWTLIFSMVAVGCAGVASYGFQRASSLSSEAELQGQLSASSGEQFVETLSGDFVDQEFGQLDRRRALIAQASRWREAMLFALVGVVLFGFAAYTASSIEPIVGDNDSPLPVPTPTPVGQKV